MPPFERLADGRALVTDGGATIYSFDEGGGWVLEPIITRDELRTVTNDDVMREVTNDDVSPLQTPLVKSAVLRRRENRMDAAIVAVAPREKYPNLAELRVWDSVIESEKLEDAAITAVAEKCPNLATLNVSGCWNLTDAAIMAVAEKCPNLAALNVSKCRKLTDAVITAVTEKCPNLAELDVSGCVNLTDAVITAVAEKCPNLAALNVSDCENLADAAITAVAEKCPNLAQLDASSCGLTALPDNIGKLSKLKRLDLSFNKLTALPRSIVELDASCKLELYENPLQTPPHEVVMQGIPAMQRFFEQLDAGAVDSTKLKLVLTGPGRSGKTSIRNAVADREKPRQDEHDRTIHLDRESIPIPVPDDSLLTAKSRLEQLTLNVFDLGGQEEYAAVQSLYLQGESLFLLIVEAPKASDEHVEDAVYRFTTLIQTRAPRGTILLVLSKIDLVDDDECEKCRKWLLKVVNQRLETWRAAVEARNEREGEAAEPLPMVHVEQTVLAVSVGDGELPSRGIDDLVRTILRLTNRFPSVGQQIPNSWFQVWRLFGAIAQHGNNAAALAAMRDGSARALWLVDEKCASPAGAYRSVDDLREVWRLWKLQEEAGQRDDDWDPDDDQVQRFVDKCDEIFDDALRLLEDQGGIFVDSGLAFLQPGLLIDMTRPLVDHRSDVVTSTDAEREEFVVSEKETISPGELSQQLEEFVQQGELGAEMLRFVWRNAQVKVENYSQILQILHSAGLIFAVKKPHIVAVVFAQLQMECPSNWDVEWPKEAPPDVFQRDMSVTFYSGGCPDALVQRIVAAVHECGTSKCAWREGVIIVSDNALYHARLERNSKKPNIRFLIRSESNDSCDAVAREWFDDIVRSLAHEESARFPGVWCEAAVVCPNPKCGRSIIMWNTSRKVGLRDVVCTCWRRRVFETTSECAVTKPARDTLPTVFEGLAELKKTTDRIEGKTDRIAGTTDRIEETVQRVDRKLDRNLNAMLELVRDTHKFPSLFYVVPVKAGKRWLYFQRELMVVFVCANSKTWVPYDGKPGLTFKVPTDSVYKWLKRMSEFWVEYGWIIKLAATFLVSAVNAMDPIDVEKLVPHQVMHAIQAMKPDIAKDGAKFVKNYAELVGKVVDQGVEKAKGFEETDSVRSILPKIKAEDGVEGLNRLDDDAVAKLKTQAKESYVELHQLLESVGFKASKLPMEYVVVEDGSVEWVRKADAAAAIAAASGEETKEEESGEVEPAPPVEPGLRVEPGSPDEPRPRRREASGCSFCDRRCW